jgi:hypothetical protein
MSVAFVVDGHTEKKIVQRLCPGSPIRMTNLNGVDVSVSAMAKVVSSLIKLFKGRYFPVFVVVDRENRKETSEALEHLLCDELKAREELKGDHIIVACPDRMIENWMLADSVFFHNRYGIQVDEMVEGRGGKTIIRRLLTTKRITYHELTVGVDIFCGIDPKQVSRSSASFRRFQDRASPYCSWLRSP